MPKKITKSVGEQTPEQIALLGIQYDNLKTQIKTLEGECKEIRKPLEQFIDVNGRTIEGGSKLAVVSHADVDVYLRQTLRVSKVLLPEAEDILRKNHLEECLETTTIVREDVIERLYAEGKIPDEVLVKLYGEKSSFAFSVNVKKHFEVEEDA